MQDKNINVAHIFLTLNMGGMESVGVDLICELQNKNVNNHVICLDNEGIFTKKLKESGVTVWCLHRKGKSLWSWLGDLVRYIRSLDIDVIHTHNPAPNLWGCIAAYLAGVSIRVSTHHGINKSELLSKKRQYLAFLASFFCTQTITVSKTLEKQLRSEPLWQRNSIATIYNGVDITRFRPIDSSVNSPVLQRNNYGIRDDEKVIGSVARFSSDKDYETLIHAFENIRSKGVAAKLLLVGDGETRKYIESQVAALTFNSDIVFLGQRTDITDLLSLFDIYVLSTHTEGVSISLLEAMAMQLPVVATAVGGNVEVVQDEVQGLLSEHGSVDSLTDKLMSLCLDEKRSAIYSLAAKKRVEDVFSLGAMTASYHELYSELYEKYRSGRQSKL